MNTSPLGFKMVLSLPKILVDWADGKTHLTMTQNHIYLYDCPNLQNLHLDFYSYKTEFYIY